MHNGKCKRRFGGIYAYCQYFIDLKWYILVLILYSKTKDYRIRSFLSIWHAHGNLCKHLGIDSSTDLDAYINRHAHTESLKMIEVYCPIGM